MTVKESNELQDLAPRHSIATVKLMEKIADITHEAESLNSIVLINEEFSDKVLASVIFSKLMAIETTRGKPELDLEAFKAFPLENKIEIIRKIGISIASLTDVLDSLKQGYYNFLIELEQIESNLMGRDKDEIKH